jgi:ribokinase
MVDLGRRVTSLAQPSGGYPWKMPVPDVVVVGQVARDLVVAVDDVPEANGTTDVSCRLEMLGGKGANQAVALAQLGVRVALIAAVGDDAVADRLLQRASSDGIDVASVVRRSDTATGLVVSVVAGGRWRYLEDLPTETLLTVADVEAAAAAIDAADAVVIQLQQPSPAALAAAQRARRAGARVVLDGAPRDDELRDTLLAAADVLRADTREAELLCGHEIADGEDAVRAGRRLLDSGPSIVILGAASEGNAVVWNDGSAILPLLDVAVLDTTGGGDAFVAAFTAELLGGQAPDDAARVATAAAALTVGRLGGRPDLSRDAMTAPT